MDNQTGGINWIDLTVENASEIRDFYSKVVGWSANEVDMGGYSDYAMQPASSDQPAAGICHARGTNAGLPAQWMIYITVDNLDQSVEECNRLGGEIIAGPKNLGNEWRYCIIRDPAGAVAALISAVKFE